MLTAIDLFRRNGYAETSMQAVADAAGISRTSLFSYFASKSELVWWDFEASVRILDEELRARPAEEPLSTSLLAAVTAMARFGEGSRELLAFRWELTDRHPELRAADQHSRIVSRLAEFVAERRAERPDDFVPLVVSHTVYAACAAASRYWAVHGLAGSHREWVTRAATPVLHGLHTVMGPPGEGTVC